MEAVGTEVIIAILIPFVVIGGIIAWKWKDVKTFMQTQVDPRVRIEENQDERQRREAHENDNSCSICLSEPKAQPVSSTCGHSFCAECIFSLYEHEHTKIKCPLCRLQINVLFKLFESSEETRIIEEQLRDYNVKFDDNRPFLRRIIQFPYVLDRVRRYMFSRHFIIYFVRNLHLIQAVRAVVFLIIYVLIPFDLIPESVLGVVGYIDDIIIMLIVIIFLVAIVATQYIRANQ